MYQRNKLGPFEFALDQTEQGEMQLIISVGVIVVQHF